MGEALGSAVLGSNVQDDPVYHRRVICADAQLPRLVLASRRSRSYHGAIKQVIRVSFQQEYWNPTRNLECQRFRDDLAVGIRALQALVGCVLEHRVVEFDEPDVVSWQHDASALIVFATLLST